MWKTLFFLVSFHIVTYVRVRTLSCSVPGEFSFAEESISMKQSDKKLVVKLVREGGSNGRIIVPWNVTTEKDDSPYKVCG